MGKTNGLSETESTLLATFVNTNKDLIPADITLKVELKKCIYKR